MSRSQRDNFSDSASTHRIIGSVFTSLSQAIESLLKYQVLGWDGAFHDWCRRLLNKMNHDKLSYNLVRDENSENHAPMLLHNAVTRYVRFAKKVVTQCDVRYVMPHHTRPPFPAHECFFCTQTWSKRKLRLLHSKALMDNNNVVYLLLS